MASHQPGAPSNGIINIKTWGDVVALSTLLGLFLGVVAWGLKLESRIDLVSARVAAVERAVGDGRLPRTETRIEDLERRIEQLERRIEQYGRIE